MLVAMFENRFEAPGLRQASDCGAEPKSFVSFERVHSEFGALVESWIRRKVANREHAEEIAQEVFLKLHDHWHRYDPSRPLLAWLRTLTRNAMTDWFRRQESSSPASATASLDEDPSIYERLPGGEPPPDARLLKRAERQALFDRLRDLPDFQRRVIWLRIVKDLSYREIADRLGVSLDSTKCAMYRARQMLMDSFAGEMAFAF